MADKDSITQPFKTVDALVEHYGVHGEKKACNYILTYFRNRLLKLLMSESNVPSKHDLSIIKHISKRIPNTSDEETLFAYQRILDFYKNREG